MSTVVRSYGFIGVLLVPMTNDEGPFSKHDVGERTYEDKSILSYNFEGTLVYIDYLSRQKMAKREQIHGLYIGDENKNPQDLVTEAAKYGLEVDVATILPYNCIWWTGGDNDLDDLTLKQFKKKYLKGK